MKQNNLFILGVTGGIGAGKSTVLSMLEDKGFFVIRADDVAKELEAPGETGYRALVDCFGKDILSSTGDIDKKAFAKKIFSDETSLKKVNNIIHPLVKNQILVMIKREAAGGRRYFAVEAALFLEAGYTSFADEVLFVRADKEIRKIRLKASRGYSDEKMTQIMSAQKPDAFYASGADTVIDNSGTAAETLLAVEKMTDRIFSDRR